MPNSMPWEDFGQPQYPAQSQMPWADFSAQESQPEIADYASDIFKSGAAAAGRGIAKAAVDPIGFALTLPRAMATGVTAPLGAGYEAIAEKTGLPELSSGAARFLTYPLGGDPDTPKEQLNSAISGKIIPAAVQNATGMNMNYQPQTKPGEYASSVGGALPYMAQGVPPVSAATMGIGSQAAKDISSLFTDNPKYQEAAGVVGGGLSALAGPSIQAKATDLLKDESTSKAGYGGLPKGTTSINEPVDVSVPQMKEMGQEAYKSAEAKGGAMTPQAMMQAIYKANKEAGYQSEEGRAFGGDNIVTKTLTDLNNLHGKPMSLQGAGEIDDIIRDRIGSAFRSGDNDAAVRLMKIRDTLRDSYTNASESDMADANGFSDWRKGDKIWSAYRTAKDIQDGIENAQYADVPSTAIKNFFKNFVKNEDNLKPLTDEETAAAKHAAQYGVITGILRSIGSRLGGHIMGTTTGLAAGSARGGGIGAAIGAPIGYVAGEMATAPFRNWAGARQAARGQNVIDTIAKRPEIQSAARQTRGLPPVEPPTAAGSALSNLPAIAAPQKEPFNPAIAEAFKKAGLKQQAPAQQAPAQQAPKPQGNASDFFAKEAKAESGGNASAKNPYSTASGSFQFTDPTWKQMVKRYGEQTGITLHDKDDPDAQAVMARLYAKDNISRMEPFLKRNPTKGELYMSHIFGADGALRLIQAANNSPDKQAMMLFPRAVTEGNRNLFFNKNQPRTSLETYQMLAKKVM